MALWNFKKNLAVYYEIEPVTSYAEIYILAYSATALAKTIEIDNINKLKIKKVKKKYMYI